MQYMYEYAFVTNYWLLIVDCCLICEIQFVAQICLHCTDELVLFYMFLVSWNFESVLEAK